MGAFPSQSGSALGTVAEESQFWQDHPPGSKRPDHSAISPWPTNASIASRSRIAHRLFERLKGLARPSKHVGRKAQWPEGATATHVSLRRRSACRVPARTSGCRPARARRTRQPDCTRSRRRSPWSCRSEAAARSRRAGSRPRPPRCCRRRTSPARPGRQASSSPSGPLPAVWRPSSSWVAAGTPPPRRPGPRCQGIPMGPGRRTRHRVPGLQRARTGPRRRCRIRATRRRPADAYAGSRCGAAADCRGTCPP
jgi:hypothetical protein